MTHRALTKGKTEVQKKELEQTFVQLSELSDSLISKSRLESRPSYRTFQTKLEAMHIGWQGRTTNRNQVMHGKAIRHCMHLMDEATQVLLIETEQSEVSEKYHLHWQKVFDSMEALTELRLCILEVNSSNGRLRVKQCCDTIKRKLKQLATISPETFATPHSLAVRDKLTEISTSEHMKLSEDELYELTSDISCAIIQSYDQILSDIANSQCRPLPKLWLI
jgi:hypothetical protein